MECTVVEQKKKIIVGLAVRTDNEKAMHDIPELCAEFQEGWQEKIENCVSDDIFCVYLDYEGDHTKPYTYIIGCEVTSAENVPKGMTVKRILGGTYAKIDVEGDYPHSLIDAWEDIWDGDLDRTFTTDFEQYGPDFVEEENCKFSIYIAIDGDNE